MSLCLSGMDSTLKKTSINIEVLESNPLIQLGNAIDWKEFGEIVEEDIKKSTSKLFWWVGRKLRLRIHLGVFVLQAILKQTDRGIESDLHGNGVYQVFCGRTVVASWHIPDHTKIEKFQNRLTPETQRKIANHISQIAVQKGFGEPSKMDVDSTVQEANMAYPSDAHLLVKLGKMCGKVSGFLKTHFPKNTFSQVDNMPDIDLKKIARKSKEYFFMAKNRAREVRQKIFKSLFDTVTEQVTPIIEYFSSLDEKVRKEMPWNIKRSFDQILSYAEQYLKDVAFFIKTETMKKGKILSFHIHQVACIKKGKAGKDKEFGRVFQLGRIAGNYFIALTCSSVRQEDKSSLLPMVSEHENIFGTEKLQSLSTDKGYYTKKNVLALRGKIEELGIQVPGNIKKPPNIDNPEKLHNRRAGIEPLIGHAKKFGLRRSRACSDETILASGYRAIMGFNLHQLKRDIGKAHLVPP